MPKKTLKRLAMTPQRLREMKGLSVFGEWIYEPNLWHINRLCAAKAFAIGLFCAMLPIPGQIFIAAFLSVKWRANLPLSIALIFVTNPVTLPVIYFSAYKLGALILGTEMQDVGFQISIDWVTRTLVDIWRPFLLGCFIIGVAMGATGYFIIDVTWRWRVIRQWRKRNQARRR
ncbi:flagellar biosynthesis protein FlhF [Luminiphilus syltensis NOR5-1B]|uniref:Flagellar biosynthesis protein FlhF n=1 Tax=Luminiphilus syltensis NOR5-1B TaxID=565045 RepID=B8KYJ1_9GAMM|nr:DUF2062 domain-containing protein [Luminiphilus syltensis]EED36835.1 flagellar biosynthesis protein FlhF [Luminiphilus syltensis NOR5-1B]